MTEKQTFIMIMLLQKHYFKMLVWHNINHFCLVRNHCSDVR